MKHSGYLSGEDVESLLIYMRDVQRYEPLSREEEFSIAGRIRIGDQKAKNKLILSNLRFVISVAKNYANQGMSLADLVNIGNMGLINAVGRFDERKNFKFISYAVWWIRQAILEGLAEQSRVTKIPLNQVGMIHKMRKAQDRISQKNKGFCSDEELIKELGLKDEKQLDIILKSSVTKVSMDGSVDPEGPVLGDTLVGEDGRDTEDQCLDELSRKKIIDILDHLHWREKEVIISYYGLDDDEPNTLEEIGTALKLTRERVRQIKDKALKKLQNNPQIKNLKIH